MLSSDGKCYLIFNKMILTDEMNKRGDLYVFFFYKPN